MQKNVSGQKVGCQMVSATDGSAFTGSVTVAVTGDAGTQATGSVGSGACTHEGNGYHTYAPAQAETNYDLIAFTFTGTGAIPATVQIYTRHDANLTHSAGTAITSSGGRPEVNASHWGGTAVGSTEVRANLINIAGSAVSTSTAQLGVNVVNFGGSAGTFASGRPEVNTTHAAGTAWNSGAIGASTLATDTITAAKIAADAIGASELASDAVTEIQNGLATASALTTLTNIFTGITSLAQWLGLIAGKQTGNSTARTELRATGAGSGTYDETTDSLEASRDNIGTAGAALTNIDLPDQTMNITGNLSGSVGSVTGNVGGNVTGSVGSVVGAVGSVTGNVGGNVTGSVGSVVGAVGSVTGNVGGNVTGSVGSLATQAKADVNAEVVDCLATDTYAEPGQGTPSATLSLAAKINYLFKSWRNKKTQTSSTWNLYADDAATVDQKATVSDDGTTATKGEVATGP